MRTSSRIPARDNWSKFVGIFATIFPLGNRAIASAYTLSRIIRRLPPDRKNRWLRPLIGKFSLIIAALALSGCVHTRFVSTYCITPSQIDELRKAEPPKVGPSLTGQADSDIRIVAGSAIRLRAWGQGLMGILEGCQEPPRAADGGGR